MALKRALNLVTIRGAPLPRQLEVARAAGYDGVGLWVSEVDAVGGAEAVATMLREQRLVPAELCFVAGWMYAEEGQLARVRAQARHVFQAAQTLGCECVVACAATERGDITDATRDFADLCALAQPFGVSVALEFIGAAQQVKDLRTAWQIVDTAGAPNGGLLLDTFHFYKGGSELADLEQVPADRMLMVHISDCPEIPREDLEDRHRIFPGAGVIPLEAIVAALVDKGYRGCLSLELFNEQYWAAEPYLVANEGMRSLRHAGL
jgi:sugar phosphate isomerase/epimerase